MTPCSQDTILETRNVGRVVANTIGPVRTVDEVSYEFKKGGIYNIVGPSGAGKSSLLRLLNRLDDPTQGEILYYGRSINSYPPTELRKKISMIFQVPYLFPGTVQSNLEYCCKIRHGHRMIDGRTLDVGGHLQRVGLRAEFAGKSASELSVGEKQRVAIARALVQEPEILLLDEPTSALDPSLAQIIEQLILSLVQELCLTAIIVTHNPDQAKRLGGETLLLVSGKLIESGPTEEVLCCPKTELGRKYVNKELV